MSGYHKRSPFVFLIVFTLATLAFSQSDKTAKNKVVVKGYLEQIVNNRNWHLWDKYFAEKVAFNGSQVNKEGLGQVLNSFVEILPDFRLEIVEQIAEGDKLFTRVMMHGTYTGENVISKKVKFWAVAVDKIVGGKVVDMWHQVDKFGMMQQLESIE